MRPYRKSTRPRLINQGTTVPELINRLVDWWCGPHIEVKLDFKLVLATTGAWSVCDVDVGVGV